MIQPFYWTRGLLKLFMYMFTYQLLGFSDSHIPSFDDDDKIDLYVLKAPVWEFKFGKLLADLVSTTTNINSFVTVKSKYHFYFNA